MFIRSFLFALLCVFSVSAFAYPKNCYVTSCNSDREKWDFFIQDNGLFIGSPQTNMLMAAPLGISTSEKGRTFFKEYAAQGRAVAAVTVLDVYRLQWLTHSTQNMAASDIRHHVIQALKDARARCDSHTYNEIALKWQNGLGAYVPSNLKITSAEAATLNQIKADNKCP